MNWIEKVRFLAEREKLEDYDQKKYYLDVGFKSCRWEKGELEDLVINHSFVPKEYIEFIKEFDDSTISFCTFFGSKKLNKYVNTLKGWTEELSEYTHLFRKDYFAFGKDTDGSVFAFNPAQEVVRFDIKDYEFEEEPEFISNNFPEFIEQYVLGPEYECNLDLEDSFSGYLHKLGWIKND